MKNKSITNKITSFSKKLKAIRKKGLHEKNEQTKDAFKNLEFDLRNTMDLQKEIQRLKSKIKDKKKELTERIKKLRKDSKGLKKVKKGKSSVVMVPVLPQEKTRMRRTRVQRKNTEIIPKPSKSPEVINAESPVTTVPKRRGRPPLKAKAAVPTAEVRKRGRKKAADAARPEPSMTKVRAAKKASANKESGANNTPAAKKTRVGKKTAAAKKTPAGRKTAAPKKAVAEKITKQKASKPAVVRKKRVPKAKPAEPVVPETVSPASEPTETAAQ